LHRFAGEYRLVEHSKRRSHPSVDSHHFPRTDDEHVADNNVVERHDLDFVSDTPTGGPWNVIQQGSEILCGATFGNGVERPPGRQHDADEGTGDILTDEQGADQREHCYQIYAHTPAAH
jgi:hypothetical protein